MAKIDPVKQEAFLKELSALTRRYRISIGACGCCGSPWLYHAPSNRRGKYECEEDGRLIFVGRGDQ